MKLCDFCLNSLENQFLSPVMKLYRSGCDSTGVRCIILLAQEILNVYEDEIHEGNTND